MLKNAKKTKIVCTLGPASQSEETLTKLIENGLNVCRFNFSHGSHEEHKERMDIVKKVRDELKKPVAILLDTKGPEIRTGNFADPEVFLEEGSKFIITMADVIGNKEMCTVSYKGLAEDVVEGDTILIDDGLVGLKVENVVGEEIHCVVENSGIVKNHKGVNVPGVKINLPALTPKDISDIEFGITQGIDFIAASFVRKASDVLAIREVLENNNATDIQIISKIENQEGVDNLDEILQVSDGLMVARGDLGVEIPTEDIPIVQKQMIKKCNALGKPVITATQMLESMITNPRPTRAEVSDVANAIYDGSSGIMLSGETASGSYPVECVKTMNKIAIEIESSIKYWKRLKAREYDLDHTNCEFIMNYAVCTTAMNVNAKAIIAYTNTGNTARMVSSFGPGCPVFAITQNETTYRQLGLYWGIIPKWFEPQPNIDVLLHKGLDKLKEENFLLKGDKVVIDGGTKVLTDVPTEDLTRNSVIGGVVEI